MKMSLMMETFGAVQCGLLKITGEQGTVRDSKVGSLFF
jgi:hypothetical protein